MSRSDDVGDLAGEVLADAGQLGEIESPPSIGAHALWEALDGPRRPAVGAHPEWVLAPELEQIGSLVEHGGDFCVLDRHCTESFAGARQTILMWITGGPWI